MKIKITMIIAALICWCFSPFTGYAQGSVSKPDTLKIEKIVMSSPSHIKEINMVNNKGDKIALPFADIQKLFTNATLEDIDTPNGLSVGIDGSGNMWISDETKLGFSFKVEGKIYPIGVWIGSKFVVRTTKDGGYTLLPAQSVKVSPPPVAEKKEETPKTTE